MRTTLLVAAGFGAAMMSRHAAADMPGLSPTLFANPGYTCVTNFYVATNGNDRTGDGSAAHPWATLAHADQSGKLAGGSCVNVEPGTYLVSNVTSLYSNGSADSPTGYVVYRSTTLGGASLRASSSVGHLIVLWGNYQWLDGFAIDGNDTGCNGQPCGTDYAVGFLAANNTIHSHHQYLTNNYVHGNGGGGFGAANGGDCAWLIHNVVYNTSQTSGYAESAISVWEPHAVSGVSACDATTFHFQLMWNIVEYNSEGSSLPVGVHTDGDGIILDSFTSSSYPYASLVAFNLGFRNGGFCVGEDNTNNATFANNTCYENYLDTLNHGTYRAELWQNGGTNDTFINNSAQSVVIGGDGTNSHNRTALVFGSAGSSTWSNNVLFGQNPLSAASGNAVQISCTSNQCATNPLWVAPATMNFALQPDSPALNYGLPESYLAATSVDAGACAAGLSSCP